MSFGDFLSRAYRKIWRMGCFWVFQFPRIVKYKFLSPNRKVLGKARTYQPVLIEGRGEIHFGRNVTFGVINAPFFWTGYIYIDARMPHSTIRFGANVWVNNNTRFVSEGEGIFIGDNTLIGSSCEFFDSDFHDLHPKRRMGGRPKTARVVVEENVFIGSNVTVLKGARIGRNSVIANGAVVTGRIPPNVIAAGMPARPIKSLNEV